MDNKRGQVTIFIILGIVLIVAAVLIYFFWPSITTTFAISSDNPEVFIQNCLQEEIEDSINVLSLQGGSMDSGHYFVYNGNKVEYLCYQEEYYLTCVVQRPLLKAHVENEINVEIKSEFDTCLDDLKESFENKGYNVQMSKGAHEVELLPKRVIARTNSSITISKGDSVSYSYGGEDRLGVVVNNNLYELTTIAMSIISAEAEYGDAETTTYMNYYRDLKVEKHKQSDGTTIYVLTDRNNGNSFMFASRSVAWPGGFGG
jgi:hypothetical protein